MSAHLSDCEGVLARAMADMERNWASTASGWRDKARADFEKDCLEEFRWNAKASLQAMRAIHEILQHAISDCS